MSIQELEIGNNQLDLLNIFPSATAILNDSGDILKTNKEWDENFSTGFFANCTMDKNFFVHCGYAAEKGSDDALKLIISLRKVIDRESDTIQATYSNRDDKDLQWYNVSIRSIEETSFILFIENITENITAVHELQESREKYRQQFNHSINGIIIGTPSGDIIDANPAACNMLGYSLDELIEGGRKMIMDDQNPLNAEAARIREKKSVFEGEKEYLHKVGHPISVMVSSVIYRDKSRGLITINSFRNITSEKQTQNKLKNEQEFTRTAIASIPGIFYVLNSEGSFLQWNETFKSELGYSAEDIVAMKPTDLFVEEDHELITGKLDQTLQVGSATAVGRIKTKHGNVLNYKLNTRSFKNDKTTYIVGTGMDITERIEAKKASDRHFRMMNQLFENTPLGIVLIGEDNKISMVNDGFLNIFGYQNGDVVGSNVDELISKKDTREEADKITMNAFNGKASQLECERFTKDGEKVPVLLNAVPISDGEKVIAVYGIYVDLTPQKELEEQITNLLHSEREAREKAQISLKENEILLQEVHHRVKNNLAVIAGLIDLQLLEEGETKVARKLSEVQSRIFSIAKIHETLYQEKNVVRIHFNRYLESFIKFFPQKGLKNESIIGISLNCDETTLNLNQAVPAGLMINEMINVLIPCSGKGNLNLDLKANKKEVEICFSGKGLRIGNFKKNIASDHFQYRMVDILIQQLDGHLDIDINNKKITVFFSKSEKKGASNAFLNN